MDSRKVRCNLTASEVTTMIGSVNDRFRDTQRSHFEEGKMFTDDDLDTLNDLRERARYFTDRLAALESKSNA